MHGSEYPNLNCLSPFQCVPSVGTVAAGQSLPLQITFSPDHESRAFRDTFELVVPAQVNQTTDDRCQAELLFLRNAHTFVVVV